MIRSCLLAIFVSCLVAEAVGENETKPDWEKIAKETDEPAFGLVVHEVFENSQAEKFGMEAGATIFQLDDQSFYGVGLKRNGLEQAFFYVPKGGRVKREIIQPGKIGWVGAAMFRPWLAYLRDEIGVRNEKWDSAVVEALEAVVTDPKVGHEKWKQVIELGYPQDDLDGMVKALTDWQLKKPIRLRPFWDQVVAGFDPVPPVYFYVLENLAIAKGDLEVLAALQESDPATALLEPEVVKEWQEIGIDAKTSPISTLKKVRALHGENVTKKLAKWDDGSSNVNYRHESLVKKWSSISRPGYPARHEAVLPPDLVDFHMTVEMICIAFEHTDNHYISQLRWMVYEAPEAGERLRYGKQVAWIGVGREFGETGAVYYRAGSSTKTRRVNHPSIQIPQKVANFTEHPKDFSKIPKDPKNLSRPLRIDIVGFGDEVALFADGVRYALVPRSIGGKQLGISMQNSGCGMRVRDFKVIALGKKEAVKVPEEKAKP